MKKERTKAWTIAVIAAIGAFILVFSRVVVIEMIYPVERAEKSVIGIVSSWVSGIWDGAAAKVENEKLKREFDYLKMVRLDIERVEEDNARLRVALKFVRQEPGNWLAAEVLSRDGGAAMVHDTLRINKGSNDGIKKDFVVAVPEGLVGIVDSVTPHTSEVLIVSDASVKIAGEVKHESGFRGVLAGNGDNEFILKYIKGGDERCVGMNVWTSGKGGVFPKGLKVGRLVSVKKDELGAINEGLVKAAVDYTALNYVFIRCEK